MITASQHQQLANHLYKSSAITTHSEITFRNYQRNLASPQTTEHDLPALNLLHTQACTRLSLAAGAFRGIPTAQRPFFLTPQPQKTMNLARRGWCTRAHPQRRSRRAFRDISREFRRVPAAAAPLDSAYLAPPSPCGASESLCDLSRAALAPHTAPTCPKKRARPRDRDKRSCRSRCTNYNGGESEGERDENARDTPARAAAARNLGPENRGLPEQCYLSGHLNGVN